MHSPIIVFMLLMTIHLQAAAGWNLDATKPAGCVNIATLSNQHTPADLFIGLHSCLKEKNLDKASELYSLANIYCRYDTKRVADRSSYGACDILLRDVISGFPQNEINAFSKHFDLYMPPNSDTRKSVCAKIIAIGKPAYFPSYMIRHGIGVIDTPANLDGLKSSFDKDKEWKFVLRTAIECVE